MEHSIRGIIFVWNLIILLLNGVFYKDLIYQYCTGVYIVQNTMVRGGGNGAGEKNEK